VDQMSRFWVNGDEVDADTFVVSAAAPGFTAGLSAFETMRTYDGHIFRMQAHLVRLRASLERMAFSHDVEAFSEALTRAAAAAVGPVRLRLTCSVEGHWLLEVVALDAAKVGRPVSAVTRTWQPPSWLDGSIKHGSRAHGEVLLRKEGVDEVLWRGADGCYTEGSRSNLFAVLGERVLTPPVDGRILAGVTRGALIEAGRSVGLEVFESAVHPAMPIDELYATSTLKELAPVVRIDGVEGPGSGPIGRRLHSAFRTLVARECSV